MPHSLTVTQVANLLEVDPATVRRWIGRKKLPATKLFGGNYRIERVALEAALERSFTDEQIQAVKQA